jgi:hypothetical protein
MAQTAPFWFLVQGRIKANDLDLALRSKTPKEKILETFFCRIQLNKTWFSGAK